MKIVELTVSISRKYNTGNYESKDYFLSLKAELDVNDQTRLGAISQELYDECNTQITDRAKIDGADVSY